jgi:hypothetical protein
VTAEVVERVEGVAAGASPSHADSSAPSPKASAHATVDRSVIGVSFHRSDRTGAGPFRDHRSRRVPTRRNVVDRLEGRAGVEERADSMVSKTIARERVRVRIPPPAPLDDVALADERSPFEPVE